MSTPHTGILGQLIVAVLICSIATYWIFPRYRKIGLLAGAASLLGLIEWTASQLPRNQADELTKTPIEHVQASAPVSATQPVIKWRYSEEVDRMRSQTTRIWEVQSDTIADFKFPYDGGSTLTLKLEFSGDELSLILSVSKGQFLCNDAYPTIAVKFDEKNVLYFDCQPAPDGSSDWIRIDNEDVNSEHKTDFYDEIRKAKRLAIEATFFQEGRREFDFDVFGLN